MTETRFDKEKIIRYFKNNVNDKYDPYINDVFCNNNKEVELKHLLARQFYDLLLEEDFNKKDLDHILYKIHYEINAKQVGKEGKKFAKFLDWSLRIAGIILLPLAILWGVKGYLDGSSGIETWVEIKAPAWTRAQFSLPDGTTGWLNSNSSLKYNGNFTTDRQVILSGEAYFDVFKDSKRPFMVNANEVNVKVLGTRFNMASYENEKSVEVVLEEGSLILYEKKMKKSYTLKPNDLIIYDNINNEFTAQIVEPQKYSSWTEGKLVFRNDPLDVIARRLERWYNVDIVVKGNADRDPRLRATFIDENLEEVLGLLKRSLGLDYIIENGNLKPDGTYAKKKVIIILGPNKT